MKYMKYNVSFEPPGKQGAIKVGKSLLEAARELGINLRADCGGKGVCGKCQVIIKGGGKALSAPTDTEQAVLKEKLRAHYRLACHAHVLGPVKVQIPKESLAEEILILSTGEGVPFKLAPSVRQYHVILSPPSLDNPLGDAERLLQSLEQVYGLTEVYVPNAVLRQLPATLHSADWNVAVTIWEGQCFELIDIQPGYVEDSYGAAVDIGTTTLVVYLVNLNNGEILATESMTNPQTAYGADIMSRLSHATKSKKGREDLRRVVVRGINQLLTQACMKAGVEPRHIAEMVCVGNTAMHHLFLGLDTQFLSRTPFTPVIQGAYNLKAGELGLAINPEGNTYLLPNIAGFVGADVVGDLLATKFYKEKEMTLLIDIGTNGELILGNKSLGLTACSVAAGPAFEGAHIQCGMSASPGAISHVRIDPSNYDVHYEVIGDGPPKGICGSGILDTVAELLHSGIVFPSGKMNSSIQHQRLRQGTEWLEFVLEWAGNTALGRDIVFTQNDVRQVQLAKAAFYAGTRILTRRLGIKRLDRVLLAGAFGSYLDPKSALAIGLVTGCEPERVNSVGNTAVRGAYMGLLSQSERSEAANVARRTNYLELTIEPDFEAFFTEGIDFPATPK